MNLSQTEEEPAASQRKKETSQSYQKGNLKAMIHFAEHIGVATAFFDVDHKQVLRFFAKIKPEQIDDPDKK